MKHTLTFILFLTVAAAPSVAQWQHIGAGYWFGNAHAFGVHDGALFFSAQTPTSTSVRDGIWKTQDTGIVAWTEADSGIDLTKGGPNFFASLGKNLFASQGYTRIVKTSNNGLDWESGNAIGPPSTNGTYLFGGLGSSFAMSKDTDRNWVRSTPPNPDYIAAFGRCVLCFKNNTIYRSLDSGSTWIETTPPSGLTLSTFAIIDTDVFAGGKGVYRSVDSGLTWTLVGLEARTVYALASYNNYLFAGMDTGVLMSSDRGTTWKDVSQGLDKSSPRNVTLMAVVDTFLYTYVFIGYDIPAQKPYGYVARRSLPEMIDTTSEVVQDVPTFDSIEIFPNPSTGVVIVSGGNTSILGVKVLNMLGSDMLDITSTRTGAFTFDLSRCAAGTYFIQIATANGTIIRKVIKK